MVKVSRQKLSCLTWLRSTFRDSSWSIIWLWFNIWQICLGDLVNYISLALLVTESFIEMNCFLYCGFLAILFCIILMHGRLKWKKMDGCSLCGGIAVGHSIEIGFFLSLNIKTGLYLSNLKTLLSGGCVWKHTYSSKCNGKVLNRLIMSLKNNTNCINSCEMAKCGKIELIFVTWMRSASA